MVAIEPVSNYLILEQYAPKRDAPTWNAAVDEALNPFSVTVIQCASDQAAALISHAEKHLGVHHSPDLFHVQYEASRATSAPLHRQTEKAEKEFKNAEVAHQQNAKKIADFNEKWPCSLQQLDLEEQARSASEIFQRSSSCVEGRNGQLSLRHHGLRELSPRKLRVLGVLHNFVIKRSDRTTAANRFFGQPHRDLFGWLIEKMPLPSRPRHKVQR